MRKLLNIKFVIGVMCILYALSIIYSTNDKPFINDLSVLNIDKPSQSVLDIVNPTAKKISDPTDRAKLAIFNQDFAKRLVSYNTDIQKLNDVYVLAASTFFKDSIKDKYDNLDKDLIGFIQSVTTDENHSLTQEEKNKISEIFLGFSWVLIQK